MTLQFQNSNRFFELHCCTGLTDWDMDEEMKLTTTTDQFFQGKKALCYTNKAPIDLSYRNGCLWLDPRVVTNNCLF